MRPRFLLPIVSAAFCGYGIQQEGQEAALQAKVDALEARVVAVEAYLQAQASHAESMSAVLVDAVAKGFVPGINFESRAALVEGWRRGVETATANVPGKKSQGNGKAVDPRVVRREQQGSGG